MILDRSLRRIQRSMFRVPPMSALAQHLLPASVTLTTRRLKELEAIHLIRRQPDNGN
jgi:hypothetical protein